MSSAKGRQREEDRRDQGKESIHHRNGASQRRLLGQQRLYKHTHISKRSVVYHPCSDHRQSKIRSNTSILTDLRRHYRSCLFSLSRARILHVIRASSRFPQANRRNVIKSQLDGRIEASRRSFARVRSWSEHTRLFEWLFVQGTALLMMIELVKRVISHARVIVFRFFLNGSFRLSACVSVFFIFRCPHTPISICEV